MIPMENRGSSIRSEVPAVLAVAGALNPVQCVVRKSTRQPWMRACELQLSSFPSPFFHGRQQSRRTLHGRSSREKRNPGADRGHFFRKKGNVPNLCNRTPLMIEVIGHTLASGAVQSPITVGMFPMLA